MKDIRIITAMAVALASSAFQNGLCAGDGQVGRASDLPSIGAHTTCRLQKGDADFVIELSGLCLSADGDFLWGVGDNGHLYKIGFDGEYECVMSCGADLEGVVLDKSSGCLYVAVEPNRVCRIRPPDMKIEDVFEVDDAAKMGNSGIEGIAWHGDNLYLGAQTKATLWEYSTTGEKLREGKSLRDVAPTISEIAGMCYDGEGDRLWVIDSNSNRNRPEYLPFTLYLFNGDATELLATYALGDFANWNPESVCVDSAHGCIWVAEDCGDDNPSLLHRIEFSGLSCP